MFRCFDIFEQIKRIDRLIDVDSATVVSSTESVIARVKRVQATSASSAELLTTSISGLPCLVYDSFFINQRECIRVKSCSAVAVLKLN